MNRSSKVFRKIAFDLPPLLLNFVQRDNDSMMRPETPHFFLKASKLSAKNTSHSIFAESSFMTFEMETPAGLRRDDCSSKSVGVSAR